MQLEIEKIIYEGFGLGHLDNRSLMVRKSVPGDLLKVDIIKEKKSYSLASIREIVRPSAERIVPKCQHFDSCGGCDHQNLTYQNQLKWKGQIFSETLHRSKIDCEILPILAGSEESFYYRNVMRYFFDRKDNGNLTLSMHHCEDFSRLIPIEKCYLQSEQANMIMDTVLKTLNSVHYNDLQFQQIRLREGKYTGELMVEIFTKSDNLPARDNLVAELKNTGIVKSFYHCISQNNQIGGCQRRLLFGSPIIYEKIGKMTFQISPDSFFQTNSLGVANLYNQIKELAEIQMGDSVLDLFCGTGTIGLYLATLAKSVTGVELVQNAVNDARANAKINKIGNCQFFCVDTDKFLEEDKHSYDLLIVDPPRSGLTRETIKNIRNREFRRLIYVSCNPATFARDIPLLESNHKLKLKRVQPIDMFPQTHHIECIGILDYK